MNILHIILPVFVGAIIGYFTNYIAIKMLFRPHKAVYIGKFKLPFTPGIIPKNQNRLAGAIGEAVSEQILTKEDVLKSLDEAGGKVISEFAENICNSDMNIAEMFSKEADKEEIIASVSNSLSKSIMEKARQLDLGLIISQLGNDVTDSLRGSNPVIAMLFNASVQKAIYEKLENAARKYLDNHGEDVLKGFISEYINGLADKPVGDFVNGIEDKERLQAAIEKAIRNIAAKYGPELLDRIDVKGIAAQRIEAMDIDELENLVLSVMKQELQAVINLGAFIGAVIGIYFYLIG